MPDWPGGFGCLDAPASLDAGAAGWRIRDPAHAAGIVAVLIVAIVAGVMRELVVDLLGGHAGIGGVEQHALRHLEAGFRQQRVDGVVAGDVPASRVAVAAPRVMQCGAVHRLMCDRGAQHSARQAGNEVRVEADRHAVGLHRADGRVLERGEAQGQHTPERRPDQERRTGLGKEFGCAAHQQYPSIRARMPLAASTTSARRAGSAAQRLGVMAGHPLGQILAHLLDPRVAGDVQPRHDLQQRPDILDQAVAERMETGAGHGVDFERAEAFDQPAGHRLHPLEQVAGGGRHQVGVTRLDLGADARHLGIAQPHPEIVGLGHRQEVAAHGEFLGDAPWCRIILRVEQPVQRRAGGLDIGRVARDEVPHRAAEGILQRSAVAPDSRDSWRLAGCGCRRHPRPGC